VAACSGEVPLSSTSTTSGAGGGSGGTGSATGTTGSGGAVATVDRGPTTIALDGDPNGLFWDAAANTLYIADDNANRVLKWTDAAGLGFDADLPPAPPNSPGLGQLVRTADGTTVVPRFGGGTAGDVVFVSPAGKGGIVPKLDPVKRRLGLSLAPDGTLYDTYFVSINGMKFGAVARLDLAGTEVDVLPGLDKPVGVLVIGSDLFVSEQVAGRIVKAPIAAPDQVTVLAQLATPDLLCEGPMGSIFTGGKAGQVRQIGADGKVNVFATGFQEVRGVAYDAKNKRLFLSDHDGNESDGVTHKLQIVPVD
jgi:sugar lactone lactonase YvrE